MVRVLAAGHVNWDVTLRVDDLPEPDGEARIESQHAAGGGSAANAASALTGYGISTGILGSVGDDENGILVRRELADANVDTTHLRVVDGETSVKYLVVAANGQVMVLGNHGANECVTPDDVDESTVSDVDHVHLTSQRPDTAAHLATLAHDAGATVSFDPGRRLTSRDFSATIEQADVLFLNGREAASILGSEHADTPPERGLVVVKHGASGASAHTPDGTVTHSGFEVDAVDTTGAGDAFAAGFLSVLLGDEGGIDCERVADALEFANACGALAATTEGARTVPTGPEVEAFLDDH